MKFNIYKKKETIASIELGEFIFKSFYKTAYKIAYKVSGKHDIAEEAAQDTMLKAITNIGQLKDMEKLEAWIKKISRNSALDIIKRNLKVIPLERIDHPDDIESNPLNLLIDTEEINTVKQILRNLHEPYFTAIHLYYYEDMKVSELSKTLEMPEGTIKSILHRARELIKHRLLEFSIEEKNKIMRIR